MSRTAIHQPDQQAFDELGTPLREVTFVVVDLETTGGSPTASSITEVGAVKVRGGQVVGELQTLVNPHSAIPPFIAVLTGITDAMAATAPGLSTVLPSFLEFARGSVLVAHNAPFDLGFLRAACASTGREWPGFDSLDTARLARRVLSRDEAPDCRLATLARLFRTDTAPCHRALADARATVGVLHGLIGRLGGLGVHSLAELRSFTTQVSPQQRRKRHLADHLPHRPGVYLFRGPQGRILYIGRSRDLRSRVRGYFVASEARSRMAEMVALAERVDQVPCAHALEAEVRELRLIAEHKPPYNRRSRHPERAPYLKLTLEAYPRLSLVRQVRGDGATYLGPFGSNRRAEMALAALHQAFSLRQCSERLSLRRHRPACALYGMGRCEAPCEGRIGPDGYTRQVDAVRSAVLGDPAKVIDAIDRRIAALVAAQRYEDAAVNRDRLTAFVRAAARCQRLAAMTCCAQMVAARPRPSGGWELAVIRHGRLVASGTVPAAAAPRPYVDALVASSETVAPGPGPAPCASAEETECLLRWLETGGSRLVEVTGTWCSPVRGAGSRRQWLTVEDHTRQAAGPLDDRRRLRPAHRPAR